MYTYIKTNTANVPQAHKHLATILAFKNLIKYQPVNLR